MMKELRKTRWCAVLAMFFWGALNLGAEKLRETLEYEREEYDYTAILRDPRQDSRPSEVTEIDRADGAPVSDDVDFEALEELALEHALLMESDWNTPVRFGAAECGERAGGCEAGRN